MYFEHCALQLNREIVEAFPVNKPAPSYVMLCQSARQDIHLKPATQKTRIVTMLAATLKLATATIAAGKIRNFAFQSVAVQALCLALVAAM